MAERRQVPWWSCQPCRLATAMISYLAGHVHCPWVETVGHRKTSSEPCSWWNLVSTRLCADSSTCCSDSAVPASPCHSGPREVTSMDSFPQPPHPLDWRSVHSGRQQQEPGASEERVWGVPSPPAGRGMAGSGLL